jgi:hypothetical protein
METLQANPVDEPRDPLAAAARVASGQVLMITLRQMASDRWRAVELRGFRQLVSGPSM